MTVSITRVIKKKFQRNIENMINFTNILCRDDNPVSLSNFGFIWSSLVVIIIYGVTRMGNKWKRGEGFCGQVQDLELPPNIFLAPRKFTHC